MGTDFFSDERRWQSWLQVEAALARVQAEAGIIPGWAADRIAEAATLERVDAETLRREIRTTMAPVHALSRCLARAAGDEAGGWVHWGATTQNVIDAGRLLVLRDVQAELKARLARVLTQLSALAETHADTPMIGRTNRQHALPITFGFKLAGWIDELIRVCDQIDDCEDRLFRLRFGGAIGAYQSLGAAGPDITARLAHALGLAPAVYGGRAQLDPLIEYVTRLAMLGVAAGRIGGDLYAAMQTETAEIAEDLGHGVVGSSTMPHKVNPKLVVALNARATRLRALGAAAFAVTPPCHEGDAVSNHELRDLVADTCRLALDVAGDLAGLLERLKVDRTAMADILHTSSALTALEAVMMHLAPTLGRAAAHDALHAAASEARETGADIKALLMQRADIAAALDAETLVRLFDPTRNTGQSAAIARQLASDGRARAARLTAPASGNRSEAANAASSARQA